MIPVMLGMLEMIQLLDIRNVRDVGECVDGETSILQQCCKPLINEAFGFRET